MFDRDEQWHDNNTNSLLPASTQQDKRIRIKKKPQFGQLDPILPRPSKESQRIKIHTKLKIKPRSRL